MHRNGRRLLAVTALAALALSATGGAWLVRCTADTDAGMHSGMANMPVPAAPEAPSGDPASCPIQQGLVSNCTLAASLPADNPPLTDSALARAAVPIGAAETLLPLLLASGLFHPPRS